MPNIYNYTDYRSFLQDFYDEQKAEHNNGFSYEILSRKMGFKSKGFVRNVIKGLRNISSSSALKFAQTMKLDRQETEYFETLVAFNQARNLNEQNFLYEKLTSIKKQGKEKWMPQLVRENQYEFYSKYYHSIIRALIGIHDFKGNFKWLAKNVYPRISPMQAKKSVQLLEKLGLIKKSKKGQYKVTEKSITTPKEVKSLALLNFHLETGKLAVKAISDLPRDKRNVSGVTLGISNDAYSKICDEIAQFRRRISKIANEDETSDSVYRLNLQFFPVSAQNIERESK